MYERMLVPLDGSEVAEAILPFAEQVAGPLSAERGEFPDLSRLVLPFNRSGFSRLRQLIDFVNQL